MFRLHSSNDAWQGKAVGKQQLHDDLNSVDLLTLQRGFHNLLCHPVVIVR